MTFLEPDTSLPAPAMTLAIRAANEGIPVAAIARILSQPFDIVSDNLRTALACGKIGTMPQADWPPTAKWAMRLPSVPRSVHPEDVEFQCKRLFKFTALEAAFMVVLLRHDHVDKDKLHGVVEEQRAKRPLRPDKAEATDPKMVDVIICKLRKKLKAIDEALILTTSWGSGYFFEANVKQNIFQRIGDNDVPEERNEPPAERAGDPQHPAQ